MQLFCMTDVEIRKKIAIIVNDLQVCRSFCTGLSPVVGVGWADGTLILIHCIMKKFFTFLLVVVLVLLCLRIAGVWKSEPDDENKALEPVEVDATADSVAMEQSTHLKFKGVPIDGPLEQFVARMVRKGFEVTSAREEEVVRLEGDFAGFKQCEVYVSTLDNQNLVSRITVWFPIQDQWKNLYGDYKTLKEMLTEKYGKPTSCVERFTGYLGNSGEEYRMSAVRGNECKYVTRFSGDEGDIILSIEHRGYSSCFVQLVYQDKENGREVRNTAIDDL